MKILFFAWLRERLNKGEEDVNPPVEVTTVEELIDWICSDDEAAEVAFAKRSLIRAAVDTKIVNHSASIVGAKTVAFFPPMTGG